MNLFGRGFGNMFGSGIFGNSFPVVMEELVYPKVPVVDTLETIFGICRDMQSDRLIQEKELAEIEAKVNTYTEYTSFHKDTMNKSYELEKKELELIQIVTNKMVALFEVVENLDESSTKFKVYIEQINRYQKILEKTVDSTGRYFNEKIIEANKIEIPEFIRYTEIGKHQNRKKLNNMREAEYV